jgi:hypothetical protein
MIKDNRLYQDQEKQKITEKLKIDPFSEQRRLIEDLDKTVKALKTKNILSETELEVFRGLGNEPAEQ